MAPEMLPAGETAPRSSWMEHAWPALLAALLVVGIFTWVASRSTLWDRDEGRFAETSAELLRSHDWQLPTFAGRLRPDKPILIYWLMAPFIAALGPTAQAVRLPSVLAFGATLLFTWAIGRRLLGARTGLLALAVLATTPLAVSIGVAATTDSVLLASLLVAAAAMVWSLDDGFRLTTALLFALGVALAQLVKGPVGLALPVLTVAGTAFFGRRERVFRWADAAWVTGASLLGFAAFAAWEIPANAATGGAFADLSLGQHVIHRMLGPLDGHGGSWLLYLPYYLVVVTLAFFPWTLHLPGALSALWGGRLGGRPTRAALLGWMVPTLLLMTMITTKVPHYVVMIWPALAIAVAGVVVAAEERRLDARDLLWLRRGIWLFAPVAALAVAGMIVAPRFGPLRALAPGFMAPALTLAATAVLAVREASASKWVRSAGVLLAGTFVVGLLLACVTIPPFEALKAAPTMARLLRTEIAPQVPMAIFAYDAFDEPSLVYYLGRLPLHLLNQPRDVEAWARQRGPGTLVLSDERWPQLADAPRRLGLTVLGVARGYNYVHGHAVTLMALARPGTLRQPAQHQQATFIATPAAQ